LDAGHLGFRSEEVQNASLAPFRCQISADRICRISAASFKSPHAHPAAGFVDSALAQRLLARGDEVYGIDNHNDYYDPALKEARLVLRRVVSRVSRAALSP